MVLWFIMKLKLALTIVSKRSQLGAFYHRLQCTITLISSFAILKPEIVFNLNL